MKFCFFSAYKDLKGGYTTLLINVIRELVKQGQEVVLYNFQDGLITDELDEFREQFKTIDIRNNDDQFSNLIKEDDVLILISFNYFFIKLFRANPRIVYYDINDFISSISSYMFGIQFRFLAKKLINKLLATSSLAFMDQTGIINLRNDLKIAVPNPFFIPVPVNIPDKNIFLDKLTIPLNIFKLTYIGRSVNWKMMPLKKILEDLSGIKIKSEIEFHIIVDRIDSFYKFINLDRYRNIENLKIIVRENVLPSDISTYLMQNSDLHFAMGTAALEGARLGIPTILMDYSTKEFPKNYSYRWIYEADHFGLGVNLEKTQFNRGISLKSVLNDVFQNINQIKIQSERCYQYTAENHGIKNSVKRLIDISKRSTFHLKDAKPYIPYYYKFHQLLKYLISFTTLKK